MIDDGAFSLVAGLDRPRAGQCPGEHFTDERQTEPLVLAEVNLSAFRFIDDDVGVAGGHAFMIDEAIVRHELAAVSGDPDLARGDRTGCHIEYDRVIAGYRNGATERVGAQARDGAPERGDLG